MWIDKIFIEGWWKLAAGYAFIFYLTYYSIYKLVFNPLMGQPRSYTFGDIRSWMRTRAFVGAVIIAPLFEEFIFTFLAYSSFLQYAQEGKEGLVVIMVAIFFSLLHFPGDFYRQNHSQRGIDVIHLIVLQFARFFFSLSSFFLFLKTENLAYSIALHYLANGFVVFYNFDAQDGLSRSIEARASKSSFDFYALLLLLMEVAFGIFGTYFFWIKYPDLATNITITCVIFILGITYYMFGNVKN